MRVLLGIHSVKAEIEAREDKAKAEKKIKSKNIKTH
jgi:hypothetical protein